MEHTIVINSSDQEAPGSSVVLVDMGTTNTRVWLTRGKRVLARATAQVGVRDTARDGSARRLRETLGSLIASLIEQGRADAEFVEPACVIAAGMITSSLGLAEVKHVPAPAGLAELAAGTRRFEFPDVTPLPVLLVPGVRTGMLAGDTKAIAAADLMRGEETLCLGLSAMGLAVGPGVVLNLGSHWKAIALDAGGRIAGSITSLAGEMIYATQTGTILASAVPRERPESLHPAWVSHGMSEHRASGLGRALFTVRLLEQAGAGTADQRMAFLVGAFIAVDLDALLARGAISKQIPIALVGTPALTDAWRHALGEAGIHATIITEQQTEDALLSGLQRILAASGLQSPHGAR